MHFPTNLTLVSPGVKKMKAVSSALQSIRKAGSDTIGVVTKAFFLKNGCLTANKLCFVAFLLRFISMSHMQTAIANENYAITFRKSEAVINSLDLS